MWLISKRPLGENEVYIGCLLRRVEDCISLLGLFNQFTVRIGGTIRLDLCFVGHDIASRQTGIK